MKKLDVLLPNTKFNRLTVVSLSDIRSKSGMVQYNCLCDCGNIKLVSASHLLKGYVKSCGCLNNEQKAKRYLKAVEIIKKDFGVASFNRVYGAYKSRAQRKQQKFSLSKEEFKTITSNCCHYCGKSPLQFYKHDKNHPPNGYYFHNGIDRKDNSIGYTLENSLPCCKICNRAKNDLTYDEFIDWINTLMVFKEN